MHDSRVNLLATWLHGGLVSSYGTFWAFAGREKWIYSALQVPFRPFQDPIGYSHLFYVELLMRRVGSSTWLKIVSWARARRALRKAPKCLSAPCGPPHELGGMDLESTKRSGEGPRSAYLLHVSMLLSRQLRSADYDPAPHSVMSSIAFTLVLSLHLAGIFGRIFFSENFT